MVVMKPAEGRNGTISSLTFNETADEKGKKEKFPDSGGHQILLCALAVFLGTAM
jgi:hypothetical protein